MPAERVDNVDGEPPEDSKWISLPEKEPHKTYKPFAAYA